MHEELNIIKDETRIPLDLSVPSGITLNFKSNIFGDLSKITCSYSYTFKLPMTGRNRRALEMAEDPRCSSKMTRRKLRCEYIQDGIPLFTDANLYIDSIEDDSFQGVMTWGVITGLQELSDDDLDLNELPLMTDEEGNLIGGEERIGYYDGEEIAAPRPQEWNSSAAYFNPFRTSEGNLQGGSVMTQSYEEEGSTEIAIRPRELPVIPVKRIIDRINAYYGTAFWFGESYDASAEGNIDGDTVPCTFKNLTESLIDLGAIPLVNNVLTQEQIDARASEYQPYSIEETDKTYYLHFKTPDVPKGYGGEFQYSYLSDDDRLIRTKYPATQALCEKMEIDGYFLTIFSELEDEDSPPKLVLYRRVGTDQDYEPDPENDEQITSLEGILNEGYTIAGMKLTGYDFDFRAENGRSRLQIDDFDTYGAYYFTLEGGVPGGVSARSNFVFYPSGRCAPAVKKGFETDLQSNLPEVSCLETVKSLYYMIGAFPSVDAQGRIVPMYYSDLQKNISSGNVLDWSDKLTGDQGRLPEKISYAVEGFEQKNWYLLKNDDLDGEPPETDDDEYEAGMGCIACDNETLEKETTIIQLPWDGPFIKDGDRPLASTGGDMKYRSYDDEGSYEFNQAEPAFALIETIPVRAKGEEDEFGNVPYYPIVNEEGQDISDTLVARIWNGFKKISSIESYAYLQRIMEEPVVITETLRLNEFDLRDLDYARPVYLSKYACYFAIVSIERDSEGECKAELIKLPSS